MLFEVNRCCFPICFVPRKKVMNFADESSDEVGTHASGKASKCKGESGESRP